MITRSEFIKQVVEAFRVNTMEGNRWNDKLPENPIDNLEHDLKHNLEHVMWTPEQIVPGLPSEWFIKMPITTDDDFWDWCKSSLQGIVRCYVCDKNGGLWWGFTNKQDIVVFILRWA